MNLQAVQTLTTPATATKATAIAAAMRPALAEAAPGIYAQRLGYLLARLTSANKDERERGKGDVRELVKVGAELLQAEKDAANLASFANKHDPDEIAP